MQHKIGLDYCIHIVNLMKKKPESYTKEKIIEAANCVRNPIMKHQECWENVQANHEEALTAIDSAWEMEFARREEKRLAEEKAR